MASQSLNIAVAGLGTVGAATLKLLREHAGLLSKRTRRHLAVTAVSARDRSKDRGVDLSEARWFEDPVAMASDPDIDVFVELIGGADGTARQACVAAIESGKHVVTANKAMLAEHGTALGAAADKAGVALAYEAAVAGGIPAIKALREGLAGNRALRVYGILNGTCNYILSTMRKEGREFAEVLAEAQKLGYAEADPGFDIDGVDAAHKLAILSALAYGRQVDFAGIHIEGIRHVSALDIAFAEELGYRIKLLGIVQPLNGGILQRVHPVMTPRDSEIASVEGVFNAVVAEGDFVGGVMCVGRGAGGEPTASAVVADIVDIARGNRPSAFSVPAAELTPADSMPISDRAGEFYVRLMVVDEPGVIAAVAAILRDHEISLGAMLQRGRAPGELVPVVMTTHEASEAAMAGALVEIGALDTVLEPPRMIRIENLA